MFSFRSRLFVNIPLQLPRLMGSSSNGGRVLDIEEIFEQKRLQMLNDPKTRPKAKPKPIDTDTYKPSDLAKRLYQQTWCDFVPSPPRKPRVVKVYPDLHRRDTKAFRGEVCTACEPEDCELPKSPRADPPKLFPRTTYPWACCKVRAPSCRTARKTIKCTRGRLPQCCDKKRAKYPSFSECKKQPLAPPVAACECDKNPSMCELWNFWRTKR
ncbi:hypothetical protein KR222_009232 [Zaprionus bogoriensis]|nr:hypothetical protein KR222_009232 [Zaprionus bogoriensis]